jgi:hypothetical protein
MKLLPISPNIDVHTIQPARHRSANIQIKDKIIANPNAAKSHGQF